MSEYAGYLVILQINLASVWTTVAQIVDLGGPSAEADQIEVSHRDSRYRRYVAGMVDGGEVQFDVIFDPDHPSHDPTIAGSMYDLLDSGEVNEFRTIYPGQGSDTTTATFDAFVSQFGIDSPMEDGIKGDITLKITGAITWAHA